LGKYEAGFAVQGETGEVRDGKKVKWLECNRLAVTVGERWSGSRRVLTIQVVAWTVNKLQEWYSSPLILEDRSLRLQEEDNLEYCLTLLPRWATRRLRERRHH
jgi:dedicator of cytokinesis protein 3